MWVWIDIWLPSIGDEYCLKRERSNKKDENAVAVVRDSSLECQKIAKQVKIRSNFVICPPK